MIEEILELLTLELKYAAEQAEYYMGRDKDSFNLFNAKANAYQYAINIVEDVNKKYKDDFK